MKYEEIKQQLGSGDLVELYREFENCPDPLDGATRTWFLKRFSHLARESGMKGGWAELKSLASEKDASFSEIVNKLENVDAAFAVSSADLVDAIKAVGESAENAGVSLKELTAVPMEIKSYEQTEEVVIEEEKLVEALAETGEQEEVLVVEPVVESVIEEAETVVEVSETVAETVEPVAETPEVVEEELIAEDTTESADAEESVDEASKNSDALAVEKKKPGRPKKVSEE